MADYIWFADERALVFDQVHVEGAGRGTLGRIALNEVKTALAEFGGQHGATLLICQRARRTSGRVIGQIPATIIIGPLS